MASDATLNLIVSLKDEASKPLAGIATNVGALGTALGVVTGGVILGGMKKLAGGIIAVGKGMLDGNAEFETYLTQFGVLLKSTDLAKKRLDELAKFGAKTPFELPELVRADKVLTAFGLHTDETVKQFGVSGDQILSTIGDVAAGTGTSFEELSVTFGKFASGATGEAIARFQELGIATRQEMADWGLEFSKTGQLLTPVDEAFGVLEEHVRAKFGGMMDAQSLTFAGMTSNLQDWIGQTLRTLGQPIFEVVKDKLADLLTFLNSPEVQAAVTAFATMLANGIGKAAEWIETTGIPALKAAWQGIKDTIAGFTTGDFSNLRIDLTGIFGEGGATFITETLQKIREGWGLARDAVVTFKEAWDGDWKDGTSILPLHSAIGNLGIQARAVFDDITKRQLPDLVAEFAKDMPENQRLINVFTAFLNGTFFPQYNVGMNAAQQQTRDYGIAIGETTKQGQQSFVDMMKGVETSLNQMQTLMNDAGTALHTLFVNIGTDVSTMITTVQGLIPSWTQIGVDIGDAMIYAEHIVDGAVGNILGFIIHAIERIQDLIGWIGRVNALHVNVPAPPAGGGGGSGFGGGSGDTGGGGGGGGGDRVGPRGHTFNFYGPADGDAVVQSMRSVGLA